MTMGVSREDDSVELSDGAEMEIVWGMQGALHLEVFLEFSIPEQVPRAADLTCNATINETMEGYVTISGFPITPHSAQTFRSGIFFIFLRDTDPGFYRGKQATVSCEVTLLGIRYVASHTVTLVDVFD